MELTKGERAQLVAALELTRAVEIDFGADEPDTIEIEPTEIAPGVRATVVNDKGAPLPWHVLSGRAGVAVIRETPEAVDVAVVGPAKVELAAMYEGKLTAAKSTVAAAKELPALRANSNRPSSKENSHD